MVFLLEVKQYIVRVLVCIRRIHGYNRLVVYLFMQFIVCFTSSCSNKGIFTIEPESPVLYRDWENTERIFASPFAKIDFAHQSCAVFGDYALFVANGRSRFNLYDLVEKRSIYTLELKGENSVIYHCNQSCFGTTRFCENDYFPLLYVSQRAKSDSRCFVEVFRIMPIWNKTSSEIDSFSIELVQRILFPPMSYFNSLGNVNCVIDSSNDVMYTYSRNNNSNDDNYGQCVITQFLMPGLGKDTVLLNDDDISNSFVIDCQAINMQGACIQDGILYIGQGYNAVGYIYLNIIDLMSQRLVRRFDLRHYGVYWEPEGCFYYDGHVMLSHSAGICRIIKLQ